MAEPIDLPFGLWTRVGRRKHKFNHICQVAPMSPYWRAHWCHPVNTIEPSVCGGMLSFVKLLWPLVIRPHRSTTYVDAAYFYRPSSVVCRSVCHTSKPCKNGCTDRAAVWDEDLRAAGEPCIRWGPDPSMGRGKFFGENGRSIVKYRHFLPWGVQKRLNRSICRLGCGLGRAEASTSSIVFARWCQSALPWAHWRHLANMIELNHPSAAAMRSYVKLLWPLVIIIITLSVLALR